MKQKLAELKSKVKKYAPEIALGTTTFVAVSGGLLLTYLAGIEEGRRQYANDIRSFVKAAKSDIPTQDNSENETAVVTSEV